MLTDDWQEFFNKTRIFNMTRWNTGNFTTEQLYQAIKARLKDELVCRTYIVEKKLPKKR